MKQKHGLHKKISSIFDGVPIPQSDPNRSVPGQNTQGQTPSAPAKPPVRKYHPAAARPNAPAEQPNTALPQLNPSMPKPPTQPQQTEAPKRTQTNQSRPVPRTPKPAAAKPRPKPLAKTRFKKSAPSGMDKVKGFFSSMQEDTEEAKQKKMTVVVGMLFPIFIAVLFFMLHQPKDTKAQQTNQPDADIPIITKTELTWAAPELLPENLRDPMRYGAVQTDNGPDTSHIDQLYVKGIVFSKTNPTAIIGDSILSAGETIMGVTIVKINKDSVEFEKDGKVWTQPVQKNQP